MLRLGRLVDYSTIDEINWVVFQRNLASARTARARSEKKFRSGSFIQSMRWFAAQFLRKINRPKRTT